MATQGKLTENQERIYKFIRKHIEAKGYPPTVRNICDQFDIKSPNGVMCHLLALEKKGWINRAKNAARAITLTDHYRPGSSPNPAELPFVGSVAAGQPIEAVASDERFNFQETFGGDNHFVLKVKGTSMIEDHIEDGDFVVIRPQKTAENGERVVAMIDGETTLKRFYQKAGRVELRPCNSSMAPLEVEPGSEAGIMGVLVGVMRKVR